MSRLVGPKAPQGRISPAERRRRAAETRIRPARKRSGIETEKKRETGIVRGAEAGHERRRSPAAVKRRTGIIRTAAGKKIDTETGRRRRSNLSGGGEGPDHAAETSDAPGNLHDNMSLPLPA